MFKSLLLLLGAFSFAYSLGVTLHEFGHAIAYILLGLSDFRINVHPFNHSYTRYTGNVPIDYVKYGVFTGSMGPLFNVTCATIITILVLRNRKPSLLPFALTGAVAYLQEGVSVFIGIIDLPLLTDWGKVIIYGNVSPVIVAIIGAIFITIGCILMFLLLPLVNVTPDDSFMRKLAIFSGIVVYFIISVTYVSVFDPQRVISRMIALVASVALVLILAASYRYIYPLLNRISRTDSLKVKWYDVRLAFGLSFVIIVSSLLFF